MRAQWLDCTSATFHCNLCGWVRRWSVSLEGCDNEIQWLWLPYNNNNKRKNPSTFLSWSWCSEYPCITNGNFRSITNFTWRIPLFHGSFSCLIGLVSYCMHHAFNYCCDVITSSLLFCGFLKPIDRLRSLNWILTHSIYSYNFLLFFIAASNHGQLYTSLMTWSFSCVLHLYGVGIIMFTLTPFYQFCK